MNAEERLMWSMYFSSVCAMQFHPRNSEVVERSGPTVLIKLSAIIADEMLREFICRIGPQVPP